MRVLLNAMSPDFQKERSRKEETACRFLTHDRLVVAKLPSTSAAAAKHGAPG